MIQVFKITRKVDHLNSLKGKQVPGPAKQKGVFRGKTISLSIFKARGSGLELRANSSSC